MQFLKGNGRIWLMEMQPIPLGSLELDSVRSAVVDLEHGSLKLKCTVAERVLQFVFFR